MTPELIQALERLSESQKQAVGIEDGPALILAGPGVGKTTVLTTRIAKILAESSDQRFRVLALTFTTKAGDEMRARVEKLVPTLAERAYVGTFHSFCTQLLRQHGSHVQIKPDFGVYDQDEDRKELLKDALKEAAKQDSSLSVFDVRHLKLIDQLRSKLVGPAKIAAYFTNPAVGEKIKRVYEIYEKALQDQNVMDFNGLILNACRLVHGTPAVAARIRQSYPYWLIDEFQDTSPAQYRFVRFLAGDSFKNIFVVADDDQIIYQWNGASYKQIAAFRENFSPQLIQIVENRRCPPEIIQAANNLVIHNQDRTPGKKPLLSTKPHEGSAIALKIYDDEMQEAQNIAEEIATTPATDRGEIAILSRVRAGLTPVFEALKARGISTHITTRRDRFISPQFIWLQCCLEQSLRPTDKQAFALLIASANHMAGMELDANLLLETAEAIGQSYMEHWASLAEESANDIFRKLAGLAQKLIQNRTAWKSVITEALKWFPEMSVSKEDTTNDIVEDKAAWEATTRAIRSENGGDIDLADLLRGMALRQKEPPSDPQAVNLLTIHAAKGLEFNRVYIIGLVERTLPSWQSLKPDAKPAELEEERRNCFVAITRTKKNLILCRANRYRNSAYAPSRFLSEMGIDTTPSETSA